MPVVIILEFMQLSRQVDHVPEEYVIETLAPDRDEKRADL